MIRESEAFKRAVIDEFFHSMTALFVNFPLLLDRGFDIKSLAFGILPAVLIDLDHFVASRSFSFAKSLSLAMRPRGHSFLFAAVVFLISLIFMPFELAWLLFSAMLSHLFFDSLGYGYGTPLLWPFSERKPGGRKFALSGLLLLFSLSLFFSLL